jgi:hypothetical protein
LKDSPKNQRFGPFQFFATISDRADKMEPVVVARQPQTPAGDIFFPNISGDLQ